MTIKVRNEPRSILHALVVAHNADRRGAITLGSNFHADVTCTTGGDFSNPTATALAVTHADATTLPTAITLAAAIRVVWLAHFADTMAHKVADDTVLAAAVPTDQSTLNTYLNEMKADLNVHVGSTTYHYTADSTNTVSATNASDLSSSLTLVNEIKADLNAHILGAAAGHAIDIVSG